MPKKVIIFGAGISGFSSAHELAEKGWDVEIYEKFNEPGGLAKSKRDYQTNIPSEYSWRGYAPWYHNIFNLMKRIKTNNGKTVYDSLSKPISFYFPHCWWFLYEQLVPFDYLKFGIEIARNAASSSERISKYSKINAADYLNSKMSKEGWEQFISTFGPWIGIDPKRASLHHVMSFFVKNIIPGRTYTHVKNGETWKSGSLDRWLVFDKPTNEAWFDPWVDYLENLGVKFYFNYSLKKFNHSKNKINYAIVKNNKSKYIIKADQYILAISPFESNKIGTSSKLSSIQCPNLIQDGPHVQVSFRIGFSEKVSWSGTRNAIILTNSEFNITMYRQDELWEENVNLGNGIYSLWSGTACISYIPGKLFNKPIEYLTKNEFKKEILYQLSKDKDFNEILQKSNKGKDFSMLPINYFETWDGWKFRGKMGITNKEPKYVDSTNTRPYQPSTKTNISNLWIAGGHTKTSTELWSMESASEAGRRAASMIENVPIITQNRGHILKLLTYIDKPLYFMNLPNVIDILIFLLITIIIYIIFKNLKTFNKK